MGQQHFTNTCMAPGVNGAKTIISIYMATAIAVAASNKFAAAFSTSVTTSTRTTTRTPFVSSQTLQHHHRSNDSLSFRPSTKPETLGRIHQLQIQRSLSFRTQRFLATDEGVVSNDCGCDGGGTTLNLSNASVGTLLRDTVLTNLREIQSNLGIMLIPMKMMQRLWYFYDTLRECTAGVMLINGWNL